MNSQIYCLPIKYGWNSISNFSTDRVEEEEKYLARRTPRPYPKIDLQRPCNYEELIKKVDRRFQKLHNPSDGSDACKLALGLVTTTTTQKEYTAEYNFPHWKKKTPTVKYDLLTDPVKTRYPRYLPLDVIRPTAEPLNTHLWPPILKVEFYDNVGKSSPGNYPVNHLRNHDPHHAKVRWDALKHLDSTKSLGYPCRRQMPGFAGHMPGAIESCSIPNQAMVASTRAVYQPFPAAEYNQCERVLENKHQGPMSRMVTLTHPFNPFTQQSAYATVGASGTQ